MSSERPKILVVGYRQGLTQALLEMGLPFRVWSNKPIKNKRVAASSLICDFPLKARSIKALALKHFAQENFDFVIPGTEAGVFPAAVCSQFLGRNPRSLRVALRGHDKLHMKRCLLTAGIPMTQFASSRARSPEQRAETLSWGFPLVSKECRESGGRGFALIHSPEELDRITAGSERRILERYIEASEMSAEFFIRDSQIVFSNITRYYEKKHINVLPAGFSAELSQRILDLSKKAISALQIKRGMVHIEFYLRGDELLFGEIALRPPGGYIMELLDLAYGFDPWKAYISMLCSFDFHFPKHTGIFTASTILHPGEGDIESVTGLEQIKSHPATARCKLKAGSGDHVDFREGTGEDVGYVLQLAPSYAELEKAIGFVSSQLHFQLKAQA